MKKKTKKYHVWSLEQDYGVDVDTVIAAVDFAIELAAEYANNPEIYNFTITDEKGVLLRTVKVHGDLSVSFVVHNPKE